MNRRDLLRALAALPLVASGRAVAAPDASGIDADFAVLRAAMAIHPGAHRYLSPGELARNLAVFESEYAAGVRAASHDLDAIRGGFHQKIAIAYVEWGAPWSQHTIVDWTVIDGPASAQAFGKQLLTAPRMAESYNSISEAIIYSTNLIENNVYKGRRKIIDISGDGPQMNGRPLPEAKALALLAGITINALVVYKPGGLRSGPYGEPLIEHYQKDVIGGRGAFAHVAEGREQFAPAILKKMILEIAEAVRQ